VFYARIYLGGIKLDIEERTSKIIKLTKYKTEKNSGTLFPWFVATVTLYALGIILQAEAVHVEAEMTRLAMLIAAYASQFGGYTSAVMYITKLLNKLGLRKKIEGLENELGPTEIQMVNEEIKRGNKT